MPPTILDIAIAWGATSNENGSISGGEFERLGLPIMGGCCVCSASIAAYNAYPGKGGYLIGKCCMRPEDVYESVEAFEVDYGKAEGQTQEEEPQEAGS